MDVGSEPVVVRTAPAPSPKSPPNYPDLCGRRRLQQEVQILNREIGFLEEELQSLEGLQPVSICCKEVDQYLGSNQDPLAPVDKKQARSWLFWKCLRSAVGLPFLPLCFFSRCLKKMLSSYCCLPELCCCSRPRERHFIRWPLCLCELCRRCWCARCSCFGCFKSCVNTTSCGENTYCSFCHGPRCSTCTRGCSRFRCMSCRLPNCAAWGFTSCLPWRWRCSCCFFPWQDSCSMPRPACPLYSCGCLWSCPRCTGARLCHGCSAGKTSCITGCLC